MTFTQEQQAMTAEFYYQEIREMKPRPGVTYMTRYYLQTSEQRQQLANWFQEQLVRLSDIIDSDWRLQEAQHWPLKGFPKVNGQQNRSFLEILEDIAEQIIKTKRDGSPGDFPMAPIDRWNRFFKGSEWELTMREAQSAERANQFKQLFKQG